jgi:hypothetical protein
VFFFAPNTTVKQIWESVKDMSLLNGNGADPLTKAIFFSLGLIPIIIACVLLIDRINQKIPVLPFIIGSFALGGFALLPYLIFREPNPKIYTKRTGILIRFAESKITARILILFAIALIIFGLTMGDFNNYWQSFKTNALVNVMSIDFIVLSLIFFYLIKDDMKRRNWYNIPIQVIALIIPVIGPCIYLLIRPKLNI